MKIAPAIIRQTAVDGLLFIMALAVAAGGLWGLSTIDAPLYSMTIFGALMVPVLMSTAVYFGRDINEATHKLIA